MGLIKDADEACKISNEIGYPVMIKASAGGGGKGMRIAWNDEEAREGFQSSKNEAKNSFGDDRIFIEKFVTQPRHIEIQVLGDKHGNCIYLGERECSIQRRNQKVIEEAPSPFLDEATRKAMGDQSVALAKAVDYSSAGTVEFIVDGDKNFYFLEMNTRLQVEHPVTELITDVDLVEQMIRVAYGEKLAMTQQDVKLNGWAIESRLYAEDPYRGFLPSIGRLSRYSPPAEEVRADGTIIRNDTGVFQGGEISMFYDPMIAKLCTWGKDRPAALQAMREALDQFEVEGIGHNLPFLSAVMDHEKFTSGNMTTAFIEEEYPDGFDGVSIDETSAAKIAAAVSVLNMISELRRTRLTGALANHKREVSTSWVAVIDGQQLPVILDNLRNEGATVTVADSAFEVETDWRPGQSLAQVSVDGETLSLKTDPTHTGFRIRWRGADMDVKILTHKQAEYLAMMPKKIAPDTSNLLLCPMPGLVVSINVSEGDEVQEGQALATVEAMKMENILRAEKKCKVGKIKAAAGDSLALDDVIMEFGGI